MSKSKKKKSEKTKAPRTKLIFSDEDIPEAEDDAGGVYLEKEDVKLIYNALKNYKPAKEEEQLYEIWLEEFDEMLVVDYNEIPPDVN